jgi:hypothetical protein
VSHNHFMVLPSYRVYQHVLIGKSTSKNVAGAPLPLTSEVRKPNHSISSRSVHFQSMSSSRLQFCNTLLQPDSTTK